MSPDIPKYLATSTASFDLTSCSVSVRGSLLAEYKILYGVNVRTERGHPTSAAWLATLIPYKILDSARRMPHKLTKQLFISKEKLQRVVEQWVE